MIGQHHRASSGDLLVLGTVMIWSVNVVVVKAALRNCPPLTYTAVRFLLGGLVLLAVARAVEGPLPRLQPGDLRALAIAGAFGIAANQASYTIALRLTTAVDVSLIMGTVPLVVAAHRALRNHERIGGIAWAGLGLGALGLVLVVGAGGASHGSLPGDLLALCAPLSWTFYLSRISGLLPRFRVLTLSALVTLLGVAPLLPLGAAEALGSPPNVSSGLLAMLAYSTLIAGAFATIAYYRGLLRLGATRAAAYSYLQPFLGAVVAAVALGEDLRPLQLVGGGVVMAGVLLGRPRARPALFEPAAAPANVSTSET